MTNNETSATIRLRDGRQLGYAEYGDPGGAPVMHFQSHAGIDVLVAAALLGEAPRALVRPDLPTLRMLAGTAPVTRGQTGGDDEIDLAVWRLLDGPRTAMRA